MRLLATPPRRMSAAKGHLAQGMTEEDVKKEHDEGHDEGGEEIRPRAWSTRFSTCPEK